LFWFRGNLQNRANAYASNIIQSRVVWPESFKIGNRSKSYFCQRNRHNLLTALHLQHRTIGFKAELHSFKICAAQDV
jgi:hypothetical protein